MGRPKVKIIDDSAPTEEKKTSKEKRTKSEPVSSDVIASEGKSDFPEAKQSSQSVEDRHVANAPRDDKTKKHTKPSKAKPRGLPRAKPRGKKYQEAVKDLDRSKTYSLSEALDMVKKISYAKFNATLEAHINTGQTGIRGLISLPYAKGRKLRILAFGKDASTAGVDLIGDETTIEEINNGKMDFDLVVTNPEWMPKLAKVARILGPRGLMPNPKNGTIADDLKKAVTGFQAGKTEYKTDPKASVIHIALGKLNQPNEELMANIKTLIQTVGKTRVKKVTLSPTMGPGVKLDLSSL